jgi:hypothetical protein
LKNHQTVKSIPELPPVSHYIIEDITQIIWKTLDTAFVRTVSPHYINFKSPLYNNLYTVGTHNGKSQLVYTSFESAVTNAIALYNQIMNKTYPISAPITLRNILIILSIFIILFIYY